MSKNTFVFHVIQGKDPDSLSVPKAMSKLGRPELYRVKLTPYLLDLHFSGQLQVKEEQLIHSKSCLIQYWHHIKTPGKEEMMQRGDQFA